MASHFVARQNLKYKYKGAVGELDVVAFSDNILFVFECENLASPRVARLSNGHCLTSSTKTARTIEIKSNAYGPTLGSGAISVGYLTVT